MRKVLSASIVLGLFAGPLLMTGVARAACAAPSQELTIRKMIVSGTTFSDTFHTLFLGRVKSIRDAGKRGGDVVARLRVWSVPIGHAHEYSRVRFYRPPPNVGVSENFEFFAGKRYAVIARRNHDGTFRFDGFCGFTTQIGLDKMRALKRLTRGLA
jgi:hypothetical protein